MRGKDDETWIATADENGERVPSLLGAVLFVKAKRRLVPVVAVGNEKRASYTRERIVNGPRIGYAPQAALGAGERGLQVGIALRTLRAVPLMQQEDR